MSKQLKRKTLLNFNFISSTTRLCELGIDVNRTDDFLRTPLFLACQVANIDCVRLLLMDKRICMYHNPGAKKFVDLDDDDVGRRRKKEDAWRQHQITGGQPFAVAAWKWHGSDDFPRHKQVVELFLKRERARVLAERVKFISFKRQCKVELNDDVEQRVFSFVDQTLITQDLIDKLKSDQDDNPRQANLRDKFLLRTKRLEEFIDGLQEDVERLGAGKIREFTFHPVTRREPGDEEDEREGEGVI